MHDEFNALIESITFRLWQEGQSINSDGNVVQIDTPYAMGAI